MSAITNDPATSASAVKAAHAGALLRYRIMAFATGIALSIAVFVAVPLKIFADAKTFSFYVWMAHGWFFLIYAVVTLDLSVRLRWHPVKWILVTLAGTVPLMSFVAEHYVTKDAKAS
jgi:integral membrane protein